MFKPMLAVNADLSKLKYPVFVSPKLDGVRATVQGGVVLSRTLKPIPNKFVQELFNELEGFDGELIVGKPSDPKSFQKTTSGVMSIEGEPDVYFHVFDIFSSNEEFGKRNKDLEVLLELSEPKRVIKVPQYLVRDEETLLNYETMFLTQGFEGLIIRSLDSPYKSGRSTVKEGYLLKLKRFTDTEATVIKFEPLVRESGEVEDTLGALVVSYDDNNIIKILKIGTGFTAAERAEIWNNQFKYLKKIVKFKYFEHGTKDLPRHPVFIGFRDKEDL